MTNNNSFDAKVLYSALAKMTNDRAVIKEAFNHWFASFADEPLDIIHVVSELEKYLGLSTPERKIDAKDLAELKDVLKDEGLPNLVGSLKKQIQSTAGDQITLKVDTSESDCQNVCHELTCWWRNLSGHVKLISFLIEP